MGRGGGLPATSKPFTCNFLNVYLQVTNVWDGMVFSWTEILPIEYYALALILTLLWPLSWKGVEMEANCMECCDGVKSNISMKLDGRIRYKYSKDG